MIPRRAATSDKPIILRTPAMLFDSPLLPVTKIYSITVLFALAGSGSSAFAQDPVPSPAPAPTAAAVPVFVPLAAPATRPDATAPKPFKEVIKDAKVIPGLFTLYQKDEKVWIEIKPEQWDQNFFFAANLSHGIGEQFIYGGLMGFRGGLGGSYVAYFRKAGNQVQLIARNTSFTAKLGSREARAVAQSFSDSLLASVAIASMPHPEYKSVLIEANTMLLADIPSGNAALERAFRQPYSFDARNSSITKVSSEPDQTSFRVSAHYAIARVVLPPAVPGPNPFTPPPTTLQDIRSLFLGYQYSFAKLPDEPMQARTADPRVGYFTTTRWDFTTDLNLLPRVHYVNRWRLEKKDPNVPLSEPKAPIVFWLDRTIPDKYRTVITDGILEWNKAFERIGFKDAIQVKTQPDDADWDSTDSRHSSVIWMTTARPSFGAIGPSQVDPRSGEILDADIGIDVVRLRNARNRRVEEIGAFSVVPFDGTDPAHCAYAEHAAQEMGFAMDLLEARGDLDPDGPDAEAFVLADLRDVMMHEVGHTLGLRHNFRASTVFTSAQLADPAFTAENGIAGSVMEYNAYNIADQGKPQGTFSMKTLGPYDYWAIEYAYKPIPAEQEDAELKKIAARSSEPLLAFSTDEDNIEGIDPEASVSDLGSDPLKFAEQRIRMARELWERWQAKPLKAGEDYAVLRRNMIRGLTQIGATSARIAKYVGGLTVLRDHAGSPRAPLNPIPAEKQRAALKLVEKGLFSADSFKFKPEFMRRLVVDRFDRGDATGIGITVGTTDYSLSTQLLAVQRGVLNQLMGESVATRVLDSDLKLDNPEKGFKLSELYGALNNSIWSELRVGGDINILRRNLQREHLAHLANALIKPAPAMPADARSLMRASAISLQGQIRFALSKPRLSAEARAHLDDSQNTLSEALKAPLQRTGV